MVTLEIRFLPTSLRLLLLLFCLLGCICWFNEFSKLFLLILYYVCGVWSLCPFSLWSVSSFTEIPLNAMVGSPSSWINICLEAVSLNINIAFSVMMAGETTGRLYICFYPPRNDTYYFIWLSTVCHLFLSQPNFNVAGTCRTALDCLSNTFFFHF